MNIEIRHKYVRLGKPPRTDKLRVSIKGDLYVVVVDGKRVDSFLHYRNAKAKVRRIKDENSRRTDSGN